jgi:hypothetical protein
MTSSTMQFSVLFHRRRRCVHSAGYFQVSCFSFLTDVEASADGEHAGQRPTAGPTAARQSSEPSKSGKKTADRPPETSPVAPTSGQPAYRCRQCVVPNSRKCRHRRLPHPRPVNASPSQFLPSQSARRGFLPVLWR